MKEVQIDGVSITPDIIAIIKDFQNERCDCSIESIDKAVDILFDVRDQYDPNEILDILGCFRLLKLYLNDLKKNNNHG